jgi:hypothetical protein
VFIGTFYLPWFISCCAHASSQRRRECAFVRHGRVGTRPGLCAQAPSAPRRRSRIFDCASQAAARHDLRRVGGPQNGVLLKEVALKTAANCGALLLKKFLSVFRYVSSVKSSRV